MMPYIQQTLDHFLLKKTCHIRKNLYQEIIPSRKCEGVAKKLTIKQTHLNIHKPNHFMSGTFDVHYFFTPWYMVDQYAGKQDRIDDAEHPFEKSAGLKERIKQVLQMGLVASTFGGLAQADVRSAALPIVATTTVQQVDQLLNTSQAAVADLAQQIVAYAQTHHAVDQPLPPTLEQQISALEAEKESINCDGMVGMTRLKCASKVRGIIASIETLEMEQALAAAEAANAEKQAHLAQLADEVAAEYAAKNKLAQSVEQLQQNLAEMTNIEQQLDADIAQQDTEIQRIEAENEVLSKALEALEKGGY